MLENQIKHRKIVIENFHEDGTPLYEDELGWQAHEKQESGSLVSREIFRVLIEQIGYNLSFYYVDNDTCYGIHRERIPIECKVLPRYRTEKYIESQLEGDTHCGGQIIASFDDEHEIWDKLKIDGKSFGEVLERSYIMWVF